MRVLKSLATIGILLSFLGPVQAFADESFPVETPFATVKELKLDVLPAKFDGFGSATGFEKQKKAADSFGLKTMGAFPARTPFNSPFLSPTFDPGVSLIEEAPAVASFPFFTDKAFEPTPCSIQGLV